MPKVEANKTGINFMIFILSFVENCLLIQNDTCFFSVCLGTGSNPADTNWLESETGNINFLDLTF